MQDPFSCSICFEAFDREDHLPYILNCGHTFCKTCLKTPLDSLRQAYAYHMTENTRATLENLNNKRQCLSRCEGAFNHDSKLANLLVNQDLLRQMAILAQTTETATTAGTTQANEYSIIIGLAPHNLDIEKFQQHFLAQLEIKPKEIEVKDIEGSLIGEKTITLKYEVIYTNCSVVKADVKTLEQKIYRQDQYESNIFVVVNPHTDKQVLPDLKYDCREYNLIMMNYGVPMRRNPETDMVVLNGGPPAGMRDLEEIHKGLKWHIQQEAEELCVRFYYLPEQKCNRIVIYLGSGRNKIGNVVQYLLNRKMMIGDRNCRFQHDEKYKGRTNFLKVIY
ncbi:hypothetical protein FGO68_gene5267 [Halteria grandinella]|uniref:RING-type domain-containing protein n=1 Tax=Halteria grandinella TaxID=5974 RepID=A0A8J8NMD8_HALGN|nr:hypothetical protein FGO68_gene5267 [Halteria grandinella]